MSVSLRVREGGRDFASSRHHTPFLLGYLPTQAVWSHALTNPIQSIRKNRAFELYPSTQAGLLRSSSGALAIAGEATVLLFGRVESDR